MLIKNYTELDFLQKYELLKNNSRILNAGSSSVRYGDNCINIDIQEKENVDIVCDVHDLPDSLGKFDAVICNAVLQYCQSPEIVAQQFYDVLKPGGYLFIDAPWVQPFCPDTPDRYRFSQIALQSTFSDFTILETGPSIRPGSAFSMQGIYMAQSLTRNKYLNAVLAKIALVALFPFRWIKTADESKTAGAFYLIGQKTG